MPDLFEEKAKDWDANEMIAALSSAVGASILNHMPLHERMSVLDFGAGTGLISSHIAPLVERVVAIDISQAMLDKLASKTELKGKVETICQDIIEDPMDERFDLIMSAMAMHHVEDTARLIKVFSEHLIEGGTIALADLDREDGSFHPADTQGVFHFGFERDELRSMLETHGFREVDFFTAHTINREGKDYPVFLVTARKSA